MKESPLQDDRRCFACGPDNPDGLKLRFEYGSGTARTVFHPHKRFAGWTSRLHGGIVATLLDESMAHAAVAAGLRAVTGRLEIRFRRAAPLDQPLIAQGQVQERRGRLLSLVATVSGEDGTIYAQGEGRFITDASGQT